jgi:hypothetical protein
MRQAMCQALQQVKQSIYINVIFPLLDEIDKRTTYAIKIDFCFIKKFILVYNKLRGTDSLRF